jgi:isopenicillin N synthase-like dioxygenase
VAPFVPVVDISRWSDGDAARGPIAAAVDDACRTLGFLQIAGHGIDAATIESMLVAADAIFGLPHEAKLAMTAPPHINRGYAPVGSESLTYSLGVDAPPDLFEAFNIGPDAVALDDPVYASQLEGVFAPNIWPPDLPGARADLVGYFTEVSTLARRLISIFAVALGLPDDHFVPMCDHATEMLRLNNYVRAQGGAEPLPGQLRMGAHTDYGIVTVLYGDRVPGLEIVGPDGEWHGVVPEQDVFLVNLGDLLARWTNDRWRSTVHRVVPPGGSGPARRRSAAFFHDGNYDAVVECLPTCLEAGRPPLYPPVVAGEHLTAKLLSGRSRSVEPRAEVVDTVGERIEAVTRDLDR